MKPRVTCHWCQACAAWRCAASSSSPLSLPPTWESCPRPRAAGPSQCGILLPASTGRPRAPVRTRSGKPLSPPDGRDSCVRAARSRDTWLRTCCGGWRLVMPALWASSLLSAERVQDLTLLSQQPCLVDIVALFVQARAGGWDLPASHRCLGRFHPSLTLTPPRPCRSHHRTLTKTLRSSLREKPNQTKAFHSCKILKTVFFSAIYL